MRTYNLLPHPEIGTISSFIPKAFYPEMVREKYEKLWYFDKHLLTHSLRKVVRYEEKGKGSYNNAIISMMQFSHKKCSTDSSIAIHLLRCLQFMQSKYEISFLHKMKYTSIAINF